MTRGDDSNDGYEGLDRARESPQVMSYVLPLLIEDGFRMVDCVKPFVFHPT